MNGLCNQTMQFIPSCMALKLEPGNSEIAQLISMALFGFPSPREAPNRAYSLSGMERTICRGCQMYWLSENQLTPYA